MGRAFVKRNNESNEAFAQRREASHAREVANRAARKAGQPAAPRAAAAVPRPAKQRAHSGTVAHARPGGTPHDLHAARAHAGNQHGRAAPAPAAAGGGERWVNRGHHEGVQVHGRELHAPAAGEHYVNRGHLDAGAATTHSRAASHHANQAALHETLARMARGQGNHAAASAMANQAHAHRQAEAHHAALTGKHGGHYYVGAGGHKVYVGHGRH